MASRRDDRSWARLCSRLDREWRRVGASSVGRSAVRRWACEEPALADTRSALEVLARCQCPTDAEGRNEALAAVLREAATDEFAQQTVIQAILPGLLALAHQARYMVDDGGSRWVDYDELEQDIVTIAYERTRALAGTTQAWPANTLLAQTKIRLRGLHAGERRRMAVSLSVDRVTDVIDVARHRDRSVAEELAQVVVDAVHSGTLAPGPAGIFYTCRVLRYEAWEVAEPATSTRSMFRSLRSSEHALAEAYGAGAAS